MKEQSRKAIERVIVKLIAKEFRLDLRAIGEAVKNETTVFDYLMIGLHTVTSNNFILRSPVCLVKHFWANSVPIGTFFAPNP
jgi:hypothetical protein